MKNSLLTRVRRLADEYAERIRTEDHKDHKVFQDQTCVDWSQNQVRRGSMTFLGVAVGNNGVDEG